MDKIKMSSLRDPIEMQKAHADMVATALAQNKEVREGVIRHRCVLKWSWRKIAEGYHMWGGGALWSPPSNQIYGQALCEAVAKHYDEDPLWSPWNKDIPKDPKEKLEFCTIPVGKDKALITFDMFIGEDEIRWLTSGDQIPLELDGE